MHSSASHGAVRRAIATFLLMSGLTAAADAAPTYALTDISLGHYDIATGINNAGQVIGSSYVPGESYFEQTAFVYSQGQTQILGMLGRTPNYGYGIDGSYGQSIARAIDGSGHIYGTTSTNSTYYDARGHASGLVPFTWSAGQMSALPNGGDFVPMAANNHGLVVGVTGEYDSYTDSDTRKAAIYENGQLKPLNIGELGWASDVNDHNQIVGTYAANRWDYATARAFIYENGAFTTLGTLGGGSSAAAAINEAGQVVGSSNMAGSIQHAFLYSNGVMQDLGSLSGMDISQGRDINAQGIVVGSASKGWANARAFVYVDGVMQDLNGLVDTQALGGWVLNDAIAINDGGTIVVQGTLGELQHVFVLTPVPEPDTWAMTLTGLLVGAGIVARRSGRPAA